MSHLLSTMNPAAAAAISGCVIDDGGASDIPTVPAAHAAASPPQAASDGDAQLQMPTVGDGVSYFPRPGELRAGKGVYAGIVTAVNDDRTLDLVVVYDADDFIGMRRVPARQNGEGMGWEPKPAPGDQRLAALEAFVDKIYRQIFGTLVLADEDSLLGIMDEHEDRIEALEDPNRTLAAVNAAANAPVKAKAKRQKAKRKAKGTAAARPTSEPAATD